MYPFLEVEGRLFLGANEPSYRYRIDRLYFIVLLKDNSKLVPLIIAIMMTQSLTVILAGMILFLPSYQGEKLFTKVFKKSVLLSIILGVSLLIPQLLGD